MPDILRRCAVCRTSRVFVCVNPGLYYCRHCGAVVRPGMIYTVLGVLAIIGAFVALAIKTYPQWR